MATPKNFPWFALAFALTHVSAGLTPCLATETIQTSPLEAGFKAPPHGAHPETWFHLIGGNVSKAGLTRDLEAIAGADISGIQLFHGKGAAWPDVSPQIQCLSPDWDAMISHVADETRRLGLHFTMQNCPGWSQSGGPWMTPENAMRELVWSRSNVAGDRTVTVSLDRPQPSNEDWRDYRDIAVLAFPTPVGDGGAGLQPADVRASSQESAWANLLAGKKSDPLRIAPGKNPAWVEITFMKPTVLRSIELPPTSKLMLRRLFDPDSRIVIQIPEGAGWKELISHAVPHGNWQDRDPKIPLVLAVPDASVSKYRIVFENKNPMDLEFIRLSSAARLQDWLGQAAYVLRSIERQSPLAQDRAAWISRAALVDLSDKIDAQGKLNWQAPAGNWTVVRFGHVNSGKKNHPAPPEATGFECDKLSAKGAEQHFAGYIGRLSAPGAAADGGRLQGMVIDSWECGTQTWTASMEQAFEKRRGYALRRWLPALAGWVVDDPRSSERFLRDWRATISDLIVNDYYGRLAELGRARGLKLSFETGPGDVAVGDILEYFKGADVPMCEFWQPNDPHLGGLATKPIAPTASAAHIYGKPRVAAESFTQIGIRWNEHPGALKNFADRNFARGITHLVFHTYTHNPGDRVPGSSFGSRIGTPFLRGQTWWKNMPLFTAYLARCGFLLEQGQPVADVLWYLGDDVNHKPRQDAPFPEGYRFDYLNADALVNRFSVREGRLVIPEGTGWRVLWLPREQCQRLTPATLAKIKDLLTAGATVIGEAPLVNPSLVGGAKADDSFTQLVKEIWGDAPAAQGDRRVGRGRLLWGGDLATTLAKLDIAPDVVGAQSAEWNHRRADDTDIYFVATDRVYPLDANLRFRATGRPEFWDPLTGTTTPVAVYQQDARGTSIPMQLPAASSVFVIFRPGAATPAFDRVTLDGKIWQDAADAARADTGKPYPFFGLKPGESIQPWVEPPPLTGEWVENGRRFLAWKDGSYDFRRTGGKPVSVKITGTRAIPLDRGWSLAFPASWDAPALVKLDELKPWSALTTDKAANHFSGSATYRVTARLDALKPDERVCLDLGRVADIAEVRINGQNVAVLWAAPFRVDITSQVKAGENLFEIEVTNTWHNRLVRDESLPAPGRKTWTTGNPPADDPLELAGLAGPVQLRIGKLAESFSR